MRLVVTALAFATLAAVAACDWFSAPNTGVDDSPAAPAWASVSSNGDGACALTLDGRVYCWGPSVPPQCTTGGCMRDTIPTRIPSTESYSALAANAMERCGLTAQGSVSCWGETLFGQTLGDGATDSSSVPRPIPFPVTAQSVSVGYDFQCGLGADSAAYCWGLIDTAFAKPHRIVRTPSRVVASVHFVSVSVGSTQACSVAVTRDAYCWGWGGGSLGIGSADTSCTLSGVVFPACVVATAPRLVVGGLQWSNVNAGSSFTCGVTTAHQGYCWGALSPTSDTTADVLGDGSLVGSTSPVPVSGNISFQSIVAGSLQACGLDLDGNAFCWGQTATGRTTTPQKVPGGLHFLSLTTGGPVACGVSVNHNLYCWGFPPADLGTGAGLFAIGIVSVPIRVAKPTT